MQERGDGPKPHIRIPQVTEDTVLVRENIVCEYKKYQEIVRSRLKGLLLIGAWSLRQLWHFLTTFPMTKLGDSVYAYKALFELHAAQTSCNMEHRGASVLGFERTISLSRDISFLWLGRWRLVYTNSLARARRGGLWTSTSRAANCQERELGRWRNAFKLYQMVQWCSYAVCKQTDTDSFLPVLSGGSRSRVFPFATGRQKIITIA